MRSTEHGTGNSPTQDARIHDKKDADKDNTIAAVKDVMRRRNSTELVIAASSAQAKQLYDNCNSYK